MVIMHTEMLHYEKPKREINWWFK